MLSSTPGSPKPLLNLTALRFFAAAYVVGFHLVRPQVSGGLLRSFLNAGEGAVSLFFVLSGFVLCHVYSGRKLDGATFYRKRFARIYPAFALALLASTPFFLKGAPTGSLPAIVSAKLLMVHGWMPTTTYAWNYPDWTLSVEAFFYACFPAALWITERLSCRAAVACLVASAVISWLSLTWVYGPLLDLTPWFGLRPLARLPEFMLGVFLCHSLVGIDRKRPLGWKPVLFVAIGVGGLLCGHDYLRREAYFALLPMAAASVVVAGALSSDRLLGGRVLQTLGEASYGIYIFHVPFDEWCGVLAARLGFELRTPLATVIEFCSLVAISVVVHVMFEVPARRWIAGPALRRRDPESRRKPLTAVRLAGRVGDRVVRETSAEI